MKQKDFDRLVTSVKQAGAIRRGRLKSEQTTEFRPEEVRAIRMESARKKSLLGRGAA